MKVSIIAEMAQLRELKVAALRARYREVYGEESRSSNRQFLFRPILGGRKSGAEAGRLVEFYALRATGKSH